MFYVLSGSIFVKTKIFDVNAKADEIILLDCREPHIYGCADTGEFLWFHFNGVAAFFTRKAAFTIAASVLKIFVCVFKKLFLPPPRLAAGIRLPDCDLAILRSCDLAILQS